MVGLVITIAQRKGGAGKTTLATQFAVTWARRGARVAALDIDPQGSFSAWVDLRRARLGAKAIGFDFAALPGWRAAQWVDDRVGSTDLVVIDAPPHAETEARIAVRVARLVVVPVQPSPLDLWATAETLKMAQDASGGAHLLSGPCLVGQLRYICGCNQFDRLSEYREHPVHLPDAKLRHQVTLPRVSLPSGSNRWRDRQGRVACPELNARTPGPGRS